MNNKLFAVLMFVWSAVLGAVLGTIRNAIAGLMGNEPLPAPARFLIYDCCSQDLRAPYFTFFEIMTITALLLLLPTFRRGGAHRRLRAQTGAFMVQTIFAMMLALLMLALLNSINFPGVLDPPMRPTGIATAIHYIWLGMVAAAVLIAVAFWMNRRRGKRRKKAASSPAPPP